MRVSTAQPLQLAFLHISGCVSCLVTRLDDDVNDDNDNDDGDNHGTR